MVMLGKCVGGIEGRRDKRFKFVEQFSSSQGDGVLGYFISGINDLRSGLSVFQYRNAVSDSLGGEPAVLITPDQAIETRLRCD